MKKAIVSFVLCCAVFGRQAAVAALPLSIDVQNVDIADVIALLGAESGENIVTDGSLKPERVTLHLHDVTFDQALNAIVSAHGLQVRRGGGILIVGPASAMSREGETEVLTLEHAQADEVAKELADALPEGTVIVADRRTDAVVVGGDANTMARAKDLAARLDVLPSSGAASSSVRSYRLRYLKPDDVVATLKAALPDGVYIADQAQNAVLVSGSEHVQAASRDLVATVDVPSPQVMFEVKVADLTPLNDSSNVGIEFGGADLQGNPLPGSAEFAFTGGTIPVYLRLNALVSDGRASILATPKLVTVNNKEADLTIGETYPIVYSTSVFGGQNVQYVDIGVHLRLTPTIGTDGSVTAELHPEYSELLGYTSTGYPIVANRKIDSTLRVKDNETIVLGGLLRDTSNETRERIPYLSDIPLLGGLFRNKSANHERDEIVFLITPHVIYPGTAPPER